MSATPDNPRDYPISPERPANLTSALNELAKAVSTDVQGVIDSIGEQQPAIPDAASDGSTDTETLNAMLAVLRVQGRIAT